MMLPQSLPWIDPLSLASQIEEPYWVLLHSSAQASYSGRFSLLACGLVSRLEDDSFDSLAACLSPDRAKWDNAWFGYLGYGLKDCLETLPADAPGWIELPKLLMMRFSSIYLFDHDSRSLTLHGDARLEISKPHGHPAPLPSVTRLESPMSKAEYLAKAADIIERIHAGELYQANLTRKIRGRFADKPDPLALYRSLCSASPAPYSALIRMGDKSIISSSPELFLRIDAQRHMTSRPIKGTAPRHPEQAQDRQSAENLAASAKDRAENLMIADLMRNDLSRTCIPGSVKAESLFEVTTHATIHHMSSTLTGQMRPECSTLDTVKACFPPGSMTGAPKIRAMELCSRMEGMERGVYSGALGWFGGDGSCELSVVIRTLVLENERFEFQVGGGIVADSTPEAEYNEIVAKSKGILAALNLATEQLPD